MNKLYLLLAFICTTLTANAQFTDDFTDADLTLNPTWSGDVASYIDTLGKLRSNNKTVNATYYLSTPSTAITNTQWELGINLQFNTSSANLVDVYLASTTANLKSTSFNAYFVRVGGTTDEISLYKRTGLIGTETKLIEGLAGVTNVSNNNLKIKVTCSSANLFSLYYDVTGTGNSYTLAGTVTDNAVTTSTSFGFNIKQSTASFFVKHFFDDIYVGPIVVDVAPPTIVSNTLLSNTAIDVLFNEPLAATTANTLANYTLNNSATITAVALDATNKALVHLTTNPITTGNYTLTINNVTDLSANVIATNSTTTFSYVVPSTGAKNDIVINEIYADNSSTKNATTLVGKGEYVELYNRSNKDIQLNGYTFKVNTTSRTLASYMLNAGQYVLLCASADTAYYNTLGQSIVGFSASALTNAGATLTLNDNNGALINTVKYSDAWYKDDTKKDGGISLERINPNDSCYQLNNWVGSSNATMGGTPATQNSEYSVVPDVAGPQLIKARVTALNKITLTFNEAVDSTTALLNANYTVSNQTIIGAKAIAPDYTAVVLTLVNNLDTGIVYNVKVNTVQDCNGTATLNQTTTVIIYKLAVPYDIVINELFADPDPSIGLSPFEYVELYNRSAKTLNINPLTLSIGTNEINLPDAEMKPNTYLLLVREGATTFGVSNYAILPENISLSNEGSLVQLYDSATRVQLHAVEYNLDYYHSTYKKDGGWSLELKNYNNPCGDDENWSASTATKGGTPGVVNSVYDASFKDVAGPKLVRTYAQDSLTVHLFFDETIDARTIKATDISINTFSAGIVGSIVSVNALSNEIVVVLTQQLLHKVVYTLTLTGKVNDCVGNTITTYTTSALALPEASVKGDILVNEMMTYANDFATDWIELYNTSGKALDLKNLLLATYDRKNKLVESAKIISTNGFIIYPNDYAVLTTKLKGVTKFYTTPAFEKINTMPSMPLYSSDTSIVLLLRGDERLDSVFSNAKYHFPLLNSTKGVSLERLSATRASGDATNWHSAAKAVGYGTPTYKNSQNAEGEPTDELTIEPPVFSPDEDGYNDVITFYYKYDKPGYVLNAYVYATEGQLIKRLKTNELLAIEGSFSWNGIMENGAKAPVGAYVVYFEAYDTEGNFKKYKRAITVATKL